jgi:ribonuclease-3
MHPLLQFRQPELKLQALTHRSYVNESPNSMKHNERLEYLGDAILGMICADYLYRMYPNAEESELTRRRSALVDESQLSIFATTIGLDQLMRLGYGVVKTGGRHNQNLLSSTFEALVGAFYIDRDYALDELQPILETFFRSVPIEQFDLRSDTDPKSTLQAYVQKQGKALPHYDIIQIGGADHAPIFKATVSVNRTIYGEGIGNSKKEATRHAAEDALKRLE